MRLTLAAASLRRHRTRTLLAILGVAVSAALLLDMVMLAGGMRESFGDLLLVRGYQLRLAPKGTLPFDSEASIAGAAELVAALRAEPRIEAVSPVFGGQLHVLDAATSDEAASAPPRAVAFALGVEPAVQGDYELESGADVAGPDQMVANAQFLRAARARVDDTLAMAAGFDPQLRAYAGQRRMAVVGVARFFYTPGEQSVVAVPLATLQSLRGAEGADRVSLIMARVRDGADVEATRRALERAMPRVSAISTATALAQVEQRLSYFRQLAFILGAISLVIGFLLVTTLVTVSANERIGEIAVLRAIGVSRAHVSVAQPHRAGRRPVDGAQQVEQRRLAAPRRPDDRRPLALADVERDAAHGVHGAAAEAVLAADVAEGDGGRAHAKLLDARRSTLRGRALDGGRPSSVERRASREFVVVTPPPPRAACPRSAARPRATTDTRPPRCPRAPAGRAPARRPPAGRRRSGRRREGPGSRRGSRSGSARAPVRAPGPAPRRRG